MIKKFLLSASTLVCLSLAGWAQPQPSLTLSNAHPQPGKAVNLTFQVKQDGQVLTDFDVVHEKTSHLVLVSADYSDYQHIHPTLDAQGTFAMSQVVFRRPGLYYVFLDVTPQGSKQIVKRFEVNVTGPTAPLVLQEDLRDRGAGDLRIHFSTMPSPLKVGDSMLHFKLTRNGQPVTDLEPLMGAMGHVIALGKGGAPFLHIHPLDGEGMAGHSMSSGASMGSPASYTCEMHPNVHSDKPGVCPKCNMKLVSEQKMGEMQQMKAEPGEVLFHANFPAPGLYKVWGQFLWHHQEIIAPFTVRVR